MKKHERDAIASIRTKLGLKRIKPSRLFLINDGAYTWIGDRSELTTKDAHYLIAIHIVGRNPSIASKMEHRIASEADYDGICNRLTNISSTCGGGIASWNDLPADWQDGSRLGAILPL